MDVDACGEAAMTLRRAAVLLAIAAALPLLGDESLHFGAPHELTGGFLRPYGLAVDEAHQRLLVADTGNNRFKWAPIADIVSGTYTFNEAGFVADSNKPEALVDPQAIAADGAGNVYVVNTLHGEVQAYTFGFANYTLDPSFCSTNPHTVDGVDILLPRDSAVGPDGSIYLLDSGNHRILKASGAGATAWTVFKSDPSWSNPYGLAVDAAGAVYIADTGNHRIVKISGATTTTFGHWGTGSGQFRFPRDVAIDQYGRVLVADTYNHRVQVLASDGHELVEMGHAPSISTLEKVAVDSSDHVFVVDSDSNHVLAFLGASVPAPFDPFMRDFVGDDGDEPSSSASIVSSPDILVRYAPDVDLAAAAAAGLESIAFQQPVYDRLNYVYIALHNRGTEPATDNFVRLYFFDPSGAGAFPADWKDTGFFSAWSDAAHNTPSDTLQVPIVPPGGTVVVGPILWRPPAPDSAIADDGRFRLAVRVTNPYDYPPSGNASTATRDSNNVTERRVQVIRTPPFGEQNTLVVLVKYPDLNAQIDEDALNVRLEVLKNWVAETSWGATTLTFATIGPITLPHNHAHYTDPSNALIVEMTQDVLDALAGSSPAILDGTGPGHEITRVILVTNDLASPTDWATTGTWPFSFNGTTRYLTASVQGGNNSMPQFAHGVSHQLGMLDLYAYDNVTFDRPHADEWDNMAKPYEGAHPLVWSKELSYWASTHGVKIIFVPRPAPGATWNNGGQKIHLRLQEVAAPGQTVAVAFGLTNGVTVFTDETAFYYVEARTKTGGPGATFDAVIPESGVLMYYANSQIPQGQGPVLLRDDVPGGTLADAAIPIGGNESPAGTGITVNVSLGTQGGDFDLTVEYSPPATDYDLLLHPGDPPWESPDIWIDDQTDGYDDPNQAQDHGNTGVAGEENRVYGRIYNMGPAPAFDAEAMFMFSEPYHTVDGKDAFDEYMSKYVDQIDPSSSEAVYVEWTPKTGVDPHTCARVELRKLFNDTNPADDAAQQNLQIDHSQHGSPYTPVEFPVFVRNEQTKAEVYYFRVDGVPEGWHWQFTPRKQLVQPNAVANAKLTLQPPDGAPDCTTHRIQVTGWVPRGDTLVRLGGATAQIDLVRKTAIDVKAGLGRCEKDDFTPREEPKTPDVRPRGTTEEIVTVNANGKKTKKRVPILDQRQDAALVAAAAILGEPETPSPDRRHPSRCRRIVVHGCTTPPQPNAEIIVRYTDENGNPAYHTVMTDAQGCYDDYIITTEGGSWQIDATFGGDKCQGPATATTTVDIALPKGDQPDEGVDPQQTFCLEGVAGSVSGDARRAGKEERKSECKIDVQRYEIRLHVKPAHEQAHDQADDEGEIALTDVRQVIDLAHESGIVLGRFLWKSKGLTALGRVEGLARAGAKEWDLSVDAIVIEGEAAGARLRGHLLLQVSEKPDGKFNGVIEKRCDLTKEQRKRIIEDAIAAEKKKETLCGGAPCLRTIAKNGTGKTILDATRESACTRCRASIPIRRFIARLTSSTAAEGNPPALRDGFLAVPEFAQVIGKGAPSEYGGRFIYFADGGDRVEGHLYALASPKDKSIDGDLIGVVTRGAERGARVYARWRMEILDERGRGQTFRIRILGWELLDCESASRLVFQPVAPVPPKVTPVTPARPTVTFKGKPAELPEKLYRPLAELPAETVDAIRRAEAGTLSDAAVRSLRVADRHFREVDVDGDHVVSPAELARKDAKQPNERTLTLLVEHYLGSYDRNKDKVITRQEAGERWKALSLLDANHDERLDVAELRESPKKLAPQRFQNIDRDRDGKITFTEFALWWRERPSASVVVH
jgi:M6 family metalloprotease-like protein